LVAKLAAGCPTVELPVDLDLIAVHTAVPGATLTAKCLEVWKSPIAEALPREQANLDLRLVEPTGVFWGVVNGKAIPDLGAHVGSEGIR